MLPRTATSRSNTYSVPAGRPSEHTASDHRLNSTDPRQYESARPCYLYIQVLPRTATYLPACNNNQSTSPPTCCMPAPLHAVAGGQGFLPSPAAARISDPRVATRTPPIDGSARPTRRPCRQRHKILQTRGCVQDRIGCSSLRGGEGELGKLKS